MKLKIKNGVIYSVSEFGEDCAIGTLFPNATEEDERIIECGSEILPEVEEFIEKVNKNEFKPRAAVKAFEQILAKHAV